MTKSATYWKNKLQLLEHPEGGCFKETYRSDEQIPADGLPERFSDARAFSTSIYFLLEKHEFSAFHRIKSDETWHFHDGAPLEIHAISPEGNHHQYLLGLDPENGYTPQVTIPHGHWFAAHSLGEFTLMGCTVAPGFDFLDFEMGSETQLLSAFPHHADLIKKYTSQ